MLYFLTFLNGNSKYVLLGVIFEQVCGFHLRLSPAAAAAAAAAAQFCVYAAAAAAAAAQTCISAAAAAQI